MKIVAIVRESPHVSRADVARLTNLARATVSSIVDDLIAGGLLRETGSKESAKGRRPIGLSFNTEARYSAGICVDQDRIDVVICDLDGVIRLEYSSSLKSDHTAQELVEEIHGTLTRALSEAQLPPDKLAAIGLAVPGPLRGGSTSSASPEKHIVRIDYRIVQEALTKIVQREVVLDTNLNMYAIAQIGKAKIAADFNTILIVRVGHLVRSAFVINDQVFEGRGKRAGEIGHLKVPGQMRHCFCGGMGCINTVASIPSIIDCCIDRNQPVRNMDEVAQAVKNGNKHCIETLQNAGIAIGYGVSAAINLLAPDMVLIAGRNVIEHDCVRHEIYAAVQRHSLAPNLEDCKLVLSMSDEKPEAYGAALRAISTHELLPADSGF